MYLRHRYSTVTHPRDSLFNDRRAKVDGKAVLASSSTVTEVTLARCVHPARRLPGAWIHIDGAGQRIIRVPLAPNLRKACAMVNGARDVTSLPRTYESSTNCVHVNFSAGLQSIFRVGPTLSPPARYLRRCLSPRVTMEITVRKWTILASKPDK